MFVRFAAKTVRIGEDRGWGSVLAQHAPLAPYVLRCIDLRANSVATVRWLDDDDVDITPRPNVLYAVEASLCTHGAAFVLRGDEIKNARVLNPHTMQIEADENGIRGFTQRIGTRVQRFTPQEIIYIHLWHPTSDVHGLAPLKVASMDMQTALAVAQFTAQFFSDGALPPIVIQPAEGQAVSETDAQVMRETWRSKVQGLRNMWRVFFTRRRLEIQTLEVPNLEHLSMRDVDDIVLRRIATAFGVPVTMITDAANYATAHEHRVSFWRDTIIPQVRLIADAFGAAYGITVYPDYDAIDALAEQEAAKRDAMLKLVQAGIVTPTEARVLLGFDTPQQASPREGVLSWREELDKWRRKSEARGVKCADFNADVLPDGVVLAVKALASRGRDPFGWARYLPAAVKAAEPPFDADVDSLVRVLLRILSQQGRDVVNLDDAELARLLSDALRPYLESVAIDSAVANMTAAATYADIEAIADLAVQWAAQYTFDLVRGLTATTRQALQRVIPRAMAEGWSNQQIADALAPYFGEARARTIAVTETTRAYAAGVEIAQQVLADDGVKTKLIWRTARDERVCPICGPRDGKPRGKGWDALPPAHPNCRCWVTIEV